MNTVIVKGRVFSLDDSMVNEIERTCMRDGREISPGPNVSLAEPTDPPAAGRVRAAISKVKGE